MMLEIYIKIILFERRQVAVAGLGELMYAHRSTRAVPEADGSVKLYPPSEELIFKYDENAAFDKGLSELIARKEHLSVADAKRIISEYAKHVRSRLDADGTYAMEGIGIFSLTEGKLAFRPDDRDDRPVLHEAIVYPIKRDHLSISEKSPADAAHTERPASGRAVVLTGFLLLLLLALTVVYGIFIKRDGFNLIEAFQGAPHDTLQVREKNTQRLSPDSLQDDSAALNAELPGVPDTVSEKTGRVYLIAGSFKTVKGAEDLLKEVQAKDPAVRPSLILPAPKYPKFKVAVWSGNTKEEAAEAYKTLSGVFGKEIWVFEY